MAAVERLGAVADRMGAADMGGRLRAEAGRWASREATVVVAGGPAQGKTAVVNALTSRPLLPEGEAAVVYSVIRRGDGAPEAYLHLDDRNEPLLTSTDELGRATVSGTHDGALVRAAQIRLAHPLLDAGLVLVDTPGIGGLEGAHGRATMATLARADALLFVADAGAPLSAADLEFLEGASRRLTTVVIALTKTDRFRGWRQVAADDRRLLEDGIGALAAAPIVPVSCKLKAEADRRAAAGRADPALASESGIPALADELRHRVLDRVASVRAANLARLAHGGAVDLRARATATLAATRSESDADEAVRGHRVALDEVRERTERALVLTTDGFAGLRDEITAEFNRAMRALGERYEAQKDSLGDPAALGEAVVADVRALDGDLTTVIDSRAAAIAARALATVTGGETTDEGDGATTLSGDPGAAPGAAPVTDPTLRMRMATTMISAGTGMSFAARFLLDPSAFVNGLVGAGVVMGVVAAALNLRTLRRQRDHQAAKRQLQATLDYARTEATAAIRQRLLTAQRALEADVKAYSRDRTRELQDAMAEATQLARADAASRAKTAAEAEGHIRALDDVAARLATLAASAA